MTSWVVIPGWDRFQHYSDRSPPWIKLYLELQTKDEWCALTLAERGLLVSIWMAYAHSGGVLSTQLLPSFVTASTRHQQLESLSHAGFIEIVASKPSRARAGAPSREKSSPSENKETRTPAKPKKTTGFKFVRGSHSGTYVADPNGTDTPPYPVPKETR